MPLSDWLGFIGGLLTTSSLIPQIIRVIKLKSAREISLIFNTSMLIGIIVWLAYGAILKLTPILIWNTIGLILTSILLFAKLRYGRKANAK